jgi:acetylornithine deacetylase/succinyl-diaminopimelate desuccinylase-like protein
MIAIFARCLAAAALLAATPALAQSQTESWRAANEKRIVTLFDKLLRIDSVAASPEGLRRTGAFLKAELEARGFTAELLSEGGSAPLVLGEYKVKGAKRTVVFYAHYDGQPVTPSQWATPPFEPVMRSGMLPAPTIDWQAADKLDPEWRLYGRGASDDKGAIIAFLAAFDALKAAKTSPKINLKVAWEGEEEAGSGHLPAILAAHKAKFAADLWLIGDGPVHQSRRPSLFFGARGVMSLDVTLYGPTRALHDGHYGNWVPNPAAMAAELVASMRAPDGSIRIPGFMDDVRAVTDAERAAIAALPPVEDAMRQELGFAASEQGDRLFAAVMRPALNIRGISGGQVGDAATNAIPTQAQISIDFRLVPGQEPARVRERVEAFLKAQGWTLAADAPDQATRLAHPRIVRLQWENGYRALRTDMSTPLARAAIRAAGGDKLAVVPMLGGSVPIYMIDEALGAPIIGLPIANHDNNQHAANENLRLKNLWDGIETYAAMMTRLEW